MEISLDEANAHASVKDLDFRFIKFISAFNLSTTSYMFYGRGILTQMLLVVYAVLMENFLYLLGAALAVFGTSLNQHL